MKPIVETLIIVLCAWLADISVSHAVTLGCPYTGCNDPGWHMPMSPPQGQPAPGPIAGTGIAYIILAGAYFSYRRWKGK